MAKKADLPEEYKNTDILLKRDNGEIVMKDGTTWRKTTEGWATNTPVIDDGKVEAKVVDDTLATQAEQSKDNNKLLAQLAAENKELKAKNDELSEQLRVQVEFAESKQQVIDSQTAELETLRAGKKGPHEGKSDTYDAKTTAPKLSGQYPHKTDDIPTVDEINASNGQPERAP